MLFPFSRWDVRKWYNYREEMAVDVSRQQSLNQSHGMSSPALWSGSIRMIQEWKVTLAGNEDHGQTEEWISP